MNWGNLIESFIKTVAVFILLLIFSVAASGIIHGSRWYLCYQNPNSQKCRCGTGSGLPFVWYEIHPDCDECCINATGLEMCCMLPDSLMFEPVGFVLDVVVIYALALVVVRGYDYLFKKKPKKLKSK